MSRVANSSIAANESKSLQHRTRELTQLARTAVSVSASISSRLPLSSEHQQMFEVAAAAERAAGSPPLLAWTTNPWAPLDPLERPTERSERQLSTALMRGERRALAVNVRSTAAQPIELRITVAVPGLPKPAFELQRVNWTGDDRSEWIAAELEPFEQRDGAPIIPLLPGVTQQIWVGVRTDSLTPPGTYAGTLRLESDGMPDVDIALEVRVFARTFPQQLATHFGGWDYADGSSNYAVTPANRAQLVEVLQDRFVDTPWAQRSVMGWDHIGPDGVPWSAPDHSALHAWVAQWPSARRFRVFLSVSDSIGTISVDDARFDAAVAAWAQGWAEEIRRLGRAAQDFDLLLVDEPHTAEDVRTTVAWARAIAGSGTGFRIWTDPVWRDASSMPPELIDAVDTISINLGTAEKAGAAYWAWARGLSQQGKRVELYACDGPSRRLDPYAYYRLAPWRAFAIGAGGVTFWSFADTGSVTGGDEFATVATNYSPLFITPDRVRSGKHMEAVVEGMEDVEYLIMLRDVASNDARADVRQRANDILNAALSGTLEPIRSSNAQWTAQTESTQAERQRIAIGEFLNSVAP